VFPRCLVISVSGKRKARPLRAGRGCQWRCVRRAGARPVAARVDRDLLVLAGRCRSAVIEQARAEPMQPATVEGCCLVTRRLVDDGCGEGGVAPGDRLITSSVVVITSSGARPTGVNRVVVPLQPGGSSPVAGCPGRARRCRRRRCPPGQQRHELAQCLVRQSGRNWICGGPAGSSRLCRRMSAIPQRREPLAVADRFSSVPPSGRCSRITCRLVRSTRVPIACFAGLSAARYARH
jgi:hypothetical protein